MLPEICKKFWNDSFIDPFDKTDQQQGVQAPSAEIPFDETALLNLPEPQKLKINSFDLSNFIKDRRTIRKYADKPVSLDELSFLLWATQGLTKEMSDERSLRTVPSAGARHAFETVLLVNNVNGLERGV